VFRGTFSPDGREFLFFKSVAEDGEQYRIFRSVRNGEEWSTPDTVVLGQIASDLYPTFDPVTGHLLFASYRPAPGDTSTHSSAYLWEAARIGSGWSEPRYLVAVSAYGYYHPQPTVFNQNCLYIRRLTSDYRDPMEWISRRESDEFGVPDSSRAWVYLKESTSDYFLHELTPGHDGTYVILVMSPRQSNENRPSGPADLFVSWRLQDGSYSPPRPLEGGVNTPGTENFVFYSPDQRELFFVRDFEAFLHVSLSVALGPRHRNAVTRGTCEL
jgi:hypothetical protein